MKALPVSLTCLFGLLAGFPIGRWFQSHAPADISHPASTETPTLGKSSTPSSRPLLNPTRSLHGKIARMLNDLADHRPGTMRHLITACQGDPGQLWLLSDLALTTDPAGFITALEKGVPGSAPKTEIGRSFAARWAKLDADAAFKTCHALPGPNGDNLSPQALETMAKKDPGAALRLLAAHPEANLNFDGLARTLVLNPGVFDQVKSLPQGMAKMRLISSLNHMASSLPPEAAFALVLEDRSASPLFRFDYISIAMIQKDPQAAQEWLLANPSHPAAASMARIMGWHLLQTDPAAAVTWTAAHLSGPIRTDTLEKAAKALETTDPTAAEAARQLLPSSFKFNGNP